MFYLFVGIVAIVIILIPIIAYSTNAASANPLVYGCIPQGQVVRCHSSLNEFESLMTTGRVQKISRVMKPIIRMMNIKTVASYAK